MENDIEKIIRDNKRTHWSRLGAGSQYDSNVNRDCGIIKVKNLTERTIIKRYAHGKVLDAGAGTGRFFGALSSVATDIVCLDYSLEMININRKYHDGELVNKIFVQGDIEKLPFKNSYFDTIVSITVVRHFPNWKNIIKEYIRVLKPGGALIFEMCSGDHIELCNSISSRFGFQNLKQTYENFEVEIKYADLEQFLNNCNMVICRKYVYDYFNNNCFLKLIGVNEYGYLAIRHIVSFVLRRKRISRFMSMLECCLLSFFPTYCSYNYMIISRKVIL